MNLIQVNFYYSSDALKGYVAVEGENISKAVSYLIPILWGCFFLSGYEILSDTVLNVT